MRIAIGGFRHEPKIGVFGEECPEALAGHRFVVGDEDFHVIVRPYPMARS